MINKGEKTILIPSPGIAIWWKPFLYAAGDTFSNAVGEKPVCRQAGINHRVRREYNQKTGKGEECYFAGIIFLLSFKD